jgi:hypothetical protein
LERFLTNLRAALLEIASRESAERHDHAILTFCCALARHCFVNEYVFDAAEEEMARAAKLRDWLAAALARSSDIPALLLAAAAMYYPLHALPAAEDLLHGEWPEAVSGLLTQQVAEPAEEREIRESIPALSPIEDEVSRAVQQQYEQNPYPRWAKAAPIGRALRLDDYLGSKFQGAGFRPLGKTDVDVLIAGCGTGQHSALLAQQFIGAQVLAIDLSRASLGYAARMTRALGLSNVAYAQADILKLASLGRRLACAAVALAGRRGDAPRSLQRAWTTGHRGGPQLRARARLPSDSRRYPQGAPATRWLSAGNPASRHFRSVGFLRHERMP